MDQETLFQPVVEPADDSSASSNNTSRYGWKYKTGAALLLIVLPMTSAFVGARLGDNDTGGSPIAAIPATGANTSDGPTESLAKIAAAVQPSVVSITVEAGRSSAEGSGVIARADGTIITNNHVIATTANTGTITVKFSDGKTAEAKIIGRDPSSDLAVIKAEGVSGLTPATMGSTSSLHVGDTVLALGSPLGLDGSVTSGIVSALHRTVDLSSSEQQLPFGRSSSPTQRASVGDAIQTDAAVNPGNSGGPLVNSSGAVVGINTAIASTGSGNGNIGVGFAIPIEEVISVTNALIDGQTPKHALLGVQIDDSDGGALIASVTSGGAAEKAGLQEGDVVTRFGQTDIDDGTSLAAAVRSHQPGDKVSVTYERNGSKSSIEVTLQSD